MILRLQNGTIGELSRIHRPFAGEAMMDTETMGRVLTEATIENLQDLWAAKRGLLPLEKVRRLTVTDALVDTGAPSLALPTRMIQQLGLAKRYEKTATSVK